MTRTASRTLTALAAIGLAAAAAFAVDPPDLEINGLTGLVETVDSTWSGSNFNVRYTVMNGAGNLTTSVLLTTNGADDLDPRIAINEMGNAYVVWWRDGATDKIVYRKRVFSTGTWTNEQSVGMSSESNSRPRITIAGGSAWVAYQFQSARSRSIGAQIIDDGPEPFRSIVATTSFSGDLDIQLHVESGHFWVTWMDTGQRVGFAEYAFDKRLWLAPAYESYAADSIVAALARIQNRVLNVSNF